MTGTATVAMTDTAPGMPEPAGTRFIPITEIGRDEDVNTRPVNTAWVQASIGTFHAPALGTPAISHRDDGTYIVLDGQNRIALAKACGYGPRIECKVYEGLSKAEEAKLFRLLNAGRNIKPGHRFKARITEQEPVAMAILEAATRAGWEIGLTPATGVITAVSTLDRIWAADIKRNRSGPPAALVNTLQTITKAWQHSPGTTHEAIIAGIGALYVKHGPAINVDEMAARLSTCERGPSGLLGKARGLADVKGGAVAHSVSDLVTDMYNKGRQNRRLPKFR